MNAIRWMWWSFVRLGLHLCPSCWRCLSGHRTADGFCLRCHGATDYDSWVRGKAAALPPKSSSG